MPEEVFSEYEQTKKSNNNKLADGFDEFNDSVDRGKEVKCSACGGNMAFDPETQTLKCEYCGATVDFEKDKSVKEIAIEKAFDQAEKWDNTIVLRCENCGAKVVMGSDEVAKECPYCGTSQIKRVDEIAGIRPNAVYPFTITADSAEQFAKKWAKRRFYAPIKFKKNIEAKNLHGVFEPGFTFDSRTFSTYRGRIGKTKTKTVGTGKNQRVVTYTEWYNISGTYSKFFDDVTITASEANAQNTFDKIMPFDTNVISVYEKKFLAGYQANHYTKDVRVCWGEAKSSMDARLRTLILDQYDHDVVDYLNVSTTHSDVTYKYVLYPIYRINYRYKEKNYDVAVNGTTGKVAGKTPISVWKVIGTVVLGIGIAVGLILLYLNGNS